MGLNRIIVSDLLATRQVDLSLRVLREFPFDFFSPSYSGLSLLLWAFGYACEPQPATGPFIKPSIQLIILCPEHASSTDRRKAKEHRDGMGETATFVAI